MKLGTTLRKIRNQKKLSQSDVAEKVGVCQSTYFAWENDRSVPNVRYYVKLAAALGVDLAELIPENLTLIIPATNDPVDEPAGQNTQALYEDLTASQKQLIRMQQHRIEQLETENRTLRERLRENSADK
ncbi:hypothetical protein GCM10023187_56710 [Nibrella viscosa]|uniref:HTH cro/C1-type domain-containing protein n=1 Tax=Nibrella viscosa TaxID=1084524 RepID=A0ABP8L238_9BACT